MLKKIQSVFRLITTMNCKIHTSCCDLSQETDPSVKNTKLPNAVTIATQQVSSPLACVSLAVVAGSRYERACNNGMSHLIEHMAFKGFGKCSADGIENEVSDKAARVSVRTTRDLQVFSVYLPAENAPFAVNLLHKVVSKRDIEKDDLKREQVNICRELADAEADPQQVLFDYLHATAFQGTPLAQRVIGPTANIFQYDPCMIAEFMRENYVSSRLCLATSGGAKHEDILSAATTSFGSMDPDTICETDLELNRFTGSQVAYRDDSMPFCHVAIAFEAPGFTSTEYYKMVAMKYMMGSWDRSQGREVVNAFPVARSVALDKLCERYKPFYFAYRDIGLWGVHFIADKWKLDEILSHLQHQWMQMCTTITDTDLQKGRGLAMLHLARKYGSVIWSSRDIGRQLLLGCRRKSLEMVYRELRAVTRKDVISLANKYLYDRCPAVASVGPSESLPEYVRIRSGMYWLRI